MSSQVSIPSKEALRGEYFTRFMACVPTPGRVAEIERTLDVIFAHRDRYEAVANKLPAPPWWIIALIHMREASLDFGTHLHNGDPLSKPTVHVPKGRPTGKGPFTWSESAWDALRYDRLDKMDYSDVAGAAYALESFNGWGYRFHANASPYLWAASNRYIKGKFTDDGHYDPSAVDAQLGAMTVLRHGVNTGRFILRGQGVQPIG